MNRRASSPSQGQRVVLQLINKEVPLLGRQTWQPHSTQETMGTPSNTGGPPLPQWSIRRTLRTKCAVQSPSSADEDIACHYGTLSSHKTPSVDL